MAFFMKLKLKDKIKMIRSKRH